MKLSSIKENMKGVLENKKLKPLLGKIKIIWEKIAPFIRPLRSGIFYFLPSLVIFWYINLITSSNGRRFNDLLGKEDFFNAWIIPIAFQIILWAILIIRSIRKKRPKFSMWSMGLYFAFCAYAVSETFACAYVFKYKLLYIIAAPLFVYLLFLPASFLFKRPLGSRIYYGVMTTVVVFYAVLQFYVYDFRGAPIRASDVHNIGSAVEISTEYSLFSGAAPYVLILAALCIVNCILLCVFSEIKPVKNKVRIGFLAVFTVVLAGFIIFTSQIFNYGVARRVIKLNYSGYEDMTSTRDVGTHLFIYLDLTNTVSLKPEGYSEEAVNEILSKFTSEKETDKKPTVIAIMDESFADFAKLGEFKTNKEYIPFYNSLIDNTVKGYVTVSAYGGYSCNSEFEFLTGNTMGFYSMGSAAYTQYVETPQDSLVNYFKGRGYHTTSMATCKPGVWNVKNAYDMLGFEEQYYGETWLQNPKLVNDAVSDETFFKNIISYYENRSDKGENPLFLFATTMQNHSPYVKLENPTITLEDIKSGEAESYLSAIHETDKAIQMLVEYFSTVDEDVVLCFFGDHYPHIPDFSEKILGSELGTLSIDKNVAIHSTPYFVWANYDIEEKQNNDMSLNYLSNTLLEVCGAPKTDFHLFLDTVKEEIPFISAFGYKGDDGNWYRPGEKSKYSPKLNEYNILQYHRVFKKYPKP